MTIITEKLHIKRSLGPKAKPTFINDSDGPAGCPALPHSALYISIVIFRALSISLSHIMLMHFFATSLLAKGAELKHGEAEIGRRR